MRLILFFLIAAAFGACQRKAAKEPVVSQITIHENILQRYTKNDELIIVTCTGCHCFIEALNAMPAAQRAKVQQYPILSDTVCSHLELPCIVVTQRALDSISSDIYNVTLLKKVNGSFLTRVIQLDEAKKILEVIEAFF